MTPNPTSALPLKTKQNCRWNLVSLGEVMLRLDPSGVGRSVATRAYPGTAAGLVTVRALRTSLRAAKDATVMIDSASASQRITRDAMTIHVGLIGGRNISQTHARTASAIPGVEASAIYGTNVESVQRLAHDIGGKPYRDFAEFLQHRPLDLVAIGSPSGMYTTHAIAAARRGLQVLSEKPIGISTERAD